LRLPKLFLGLFLQHIFRFITHRLWCGLFFKIEDNGAALITHHLPAVNEGNCVSVSATAADCRLVVE
jgi:hypothetical protein